MSNRCLQAEKGFVTWVWISTWPVYSLASSMCCGCRGWFFHCAVLLQEPFMGVSVRKRMWISFTSCPFLWSLACFPLDWNGWKCCWFCVAIQHTTISKCFLPSKWISGGHCSFRLLLCLFLETFSFLFHSLNCCSALTSKKLKRHL